MTSSHLLSFTRLADIITRYGTICQLHLAPSIDEAAPWQLAPDTEEVVEVPRASPAPITYEARLLLADPILVTQQDSHVTNGDGLCLVTVPSDMMSDDFILTSGMVKDDTTSWQITTAQLMAEEGHQLVFRLLLTSQRRAAS